MGAGRASRQIVRSEDYRSTHIRGYVTSDSPANTLSTTAQIQAEDVSRVALQASAGEQDDLLDTVEVLIASAIHNNHSAPPGYSLPCFLCRRDAKAVLDRLHNMGLGVTATVA